MDVRCRIETCRFSRPFRFSEHVWTESEVVVAEIRDRGHAGRGEACGVCYKQETARGMIDQIEAFARGREASPATT